MDWSFGLAIVSTPKVTIQQDAGHTAQHVIKDLNRLSNTNWDTRQSVVDPFIIIDVILLRGSVV